MESQLITLARMSAEKDADFQSAYLFLQWSRIEKSLSRVSVELCCGACGHVYTVVESSCAEKALLSNSVIIIITVR